MKWAQTFKSTVTTEIRLNRFVSPLTVKWVTHPIISQGHRGSGLMKKHCFYRMTDYPGDKWAMIYIYCRWEYKMENNRRIYSLSKHFSYKRFNLIMISLVFSCNIGTLSFFEQHTQLLSIDHNQVNMARGNQSELVNIFIWNYKI